MDPMTAMALAKVATSGIEGLMGMSQAKSQGRALVSQANYEMRNIKRQTQNRAADIKLSFLNSGFDLIGTPEMSIASAFKTGQEDVNRLVSDVNNRSKNLFRKARTSFISGLVSSASEFASAYMQGASTTSSEEEDFTWSANSLNGTPYLAGVRKL